LVDIGHRTLQAFTSLTVAAPPPLIGTLPDLIGSACLHVLICLTLQWLTRTDAPPRLTLRAPLRTHKTCCLCKYDFLLTERKLEAGYFRIHVSRSISESQSRYIIVESRTSNNSNATKLKYHRITVSSPSQIGSDNDRSSSSVCSANKSYPLPHMYCLYRWEMDDSITVLLLSEAHDVA
jgi:hypothetical protein